MEEEIVDQRCQIKGVFVELALWFVSASCTSRHHFGFIVKVLFGPRHFLTETNCINQSNLPRMVIRLLPRRPGLTLNVGTHQNQQARASPPTGPALSGRSGLQMSPQPLGSDRSAQRLRGGRHPAGGRRRSFVEPEPVFVVCVHYFSRVLCYKDKLFLSYLNARQRAENSSSTFLIIGPLISDLKI